MSRRKPGPYPPPFNQLPAAAAELAMGLGGGSAVQSYGLSRSSLTGDSVRTADGVANPAAFSTFALYNVAAVGVVRGLMLGWGWGGALVGGHAMQSNGSTLEFIVRTPSAAAITASKVMAAAPAAQPETLYWGTATGTTSKCGYGDPAVNAPGTATITGGINTTESNLGASIFERADYEYIESAGSGVFAVLNRAVSEAEVTALHAGPGTVREELVSFLLAEVELGNVEWWPAPAAGLADGQEIATSADLVDLSGNRTCEVHSESSRLEAVS